MSGLEEAVLKNIDACKQLSQMTRTSLGPQGLNKMVINHLDKLFVTSDAATILEQLEVNHPAAKILAMGAQSQQSENGDGTNLVVSVGGELLSQATDLLQDGLHPSEVVQGYQKAADIVYNTLKELCISGSQKLDLANEADVSKRVKGVIAAKQYGVEGIVAPLVVRACVAVCQTDPDGAAHGNFNVDNVRVAKLSGSGIEQSEVVNGLLLKRDTEGTVKHVKDGKVAVYATAVDTQGTETKGTVLLHNAQELESYSKGEEQKMEEHISAIANTGAKVIVGNQNFGELALHFIERYGMMAIKIPSKFELRRFCRAVGATSLVQLQAPQADELGYISNLDVEEIGGHKVTVARQKDAASQLATIVLRGATENVMDDVERAVDDGVNAFRTACRDARLLPGGGATELALSRKLREEAKRETGLEQYAINKFAESLEIIPRVIAENSGLNATDALSNLHAAHAAGNSSAGIDVEGETQVKDLGGEGIYDLHATKSSAMQLLVDAACTVLRVVRFLFLNASVIITARVLVLLLHCNAVIIRW